MLTNPPFSYDFCVANPISCGEAVIVTVIVKTGCGTDDSICGTTNYTINMGDI